MRNPGQYGLGAAPCPRSNLTLHTSHGAGAAVRHTVQALQCIRHTVQALQRRQVHWATTAPERSVSVIRCSAHASAHAALTPLHPPSSSVATQPAQSCVPHQLHTCTISTHTPCLQQHPGPPRTSVQGCRKPTASPARQPAGTTETLPSSCGPRPNRFRTCRSSVIRGANV